ncbi:MAG: TetR/AcrR family transcriptional regulator [Turneriella sp.]|nr:TetR/AcrR family transcriptional regulator [Turneriella sp.]
MYVVKVNRATGKRRQRSAISVRERLENTADALFSQQGYAVTPVRDLMHAAGVVPRSFYDTFPSKKELGLVYLRRKEEESMADLKALMRDYPEPKQLFRAWVLAKKRQIKRGEFFGCPFLRFALQMPAGDADFQKQLKSVTKMWEDLLRDYIGDAIALGHLPRETDALALARMALAVYEGNVAMWRISGLTIYLDQMPEMFEAILKG